MTNLEMLQAHSKVERAERTPDGIVLVLKRGYSFARDREERKVGPAPVSTILNQLRAVCPI